MTAPKRSSLLLAACGLIVAAGMQTAAAADPEAVAERVKQAFLKQGFALEWSSLEGDGTAELVFGGVTVKPPAQAGDFTMGDMRLTDIEEAGGGYRIGELHIAPSRVSGEGLEIALGDMRLTGVEIPEEGRGGPLGDMMLYRTGRLDRLAAERGGERLFSMEALVFNLDRTPDGGGLSFDGTAERFDADLTRLDDARTREIAASLGFSQISGSIELEGSWNAEDGRAKLDRYDIRIDDAGTLGITVELGGYTQAFMKALADYQARAATAGEEENQALGMEALGLMQQLSLHGASIRFEDNTLTEKVLGYVADQQGARPRDVANQTKAVVPFLLAQLDNPDLAAQVSNAVSTYLDAPRSLTIRAQPAAPVPFAMLAAGAMMAPKALPQQLGVTVTAND